MKNECFYIILVVSNTIFHEKAQYLAFIVLSQKKD